MNRLIIIGASGHGKVVADVARLNGYTDIVFLDDNSEIKTCAGSSVLGSTSMVDALEGDVFVAVGNAEVRKSLMEKYSERVFPVLIHPNAVVADTVTIGDGTVIMAGVVINAETTIGRGCIINTSSSVDHDCKISDYVHVSVGAHIAGTVTVGLETWVGAGAIISNNVTVCDNCLIGVGAVVIRDLEVRGTYVGVPSKRIK